MFTRPPKMTPMLRFIRLHLLTMAGFLLAAAPLAAQVAGAKNVVINEIASLSSADHAVELYNYGPDAALAGWTITYAGNAAYTLPTVTLLRHTALLVHWATGTNTTTNLYTGFAATVDGNGQLLL